MMRSPTPENPTCRSLLAGLVALAFAATAVPVAHAAEPARYVLPEAPAAYAEYRDAAETFMARWYRGRTDIAPLKIAYRPEFRPRGFMVYRTFLGGTVFVTGDGPEARMVCAMVHELTHHYDYYNGRLAGADCGIVERRAYEMQNLCRAERYGLPPEDVEAGVERSCAAQAKYSIGAQD